MPMIEPFAGIICHSWGIIDDILLNPQIGPHRSIRGPGHSQLLSVSGAPRRTGTCWLNWKFQINRHCLAFNRKEGYDASDDKLIPPIYPARLRRRPAPGRRGGRL
jgi:hypothetical protein